jgi:hypothetical protein
MVGIAQGLVYTGLGCNMCGNIYEQVWKTSGEKNIGEKNEHLC